jgi:hypothetical protein
MRSSSSWIAMIKVDRTRNREKTMTTGTARETAWLRRWACEQIGVDAKATLTEARAALLRQLSESDFVPPSLWPQALAILEGKRHPAAEAAALREQQEMLRNAVEAFAGRFWSFSVDERRRRWEDLHGACVVAPALRARLGELERGLDVRPMEADSPQTADLVQSLQELFVLRPAERAARRRELLRRAEHEPSWNHTVAVIRKRYSTLAALHPGLLDKPMDADSRQQRQAALQKALFRPRRQRILVTPSPSGKKSGFAWGTIVLVAVLGGIRLCAGGLNSTSSSSRSDPSQAPRIPRFDPKNYEIPKWSPPPELHPELPSSQGKGSGRFDPKNPLSNDERWRKLLEDARRRGVSPPGASGSRARDGDRDPAATSGSAASGSGGP